MAKKGQKQNIYSNEFKKEVLEKYHSGYAGTRRLGKEYNIPQHTIDTWLYMEKQGKNVYFESRKGMGGRKKVKDIDYKEQYEILKKMEKFLMQLREKNQFSLTHLETNIQ